MSSALSAGNHGRVVEVVCHSLSGSRPMLTTSVPRATVLLSQLIGHAVGPHGRRRQPKSAMRQIALRGLGAIYVWSASRRPRGVPLHLRTRVSDRAVGAPGAQRQILPEAGEPWLMHLRPTIVSPAHRRWAIPASAAVVAAGPTCRQLPCPTLWLSSQPIFLPHNSEN